MAGLREPFGITASSGTILMGPFVDENDGTTPLPGLTINNSDVRISKNNVDFVANTADVDPEHVADGIYSIYLDSVEINTAGHIIVAIHVAGALPIWRKFQVAPSS